MVMSNVALDLPGMLDKLRSIFAGAAWQPCRPCVPFVNVDVEGLDAVKRN